LQPEASNSDDTADMLSLQQQMEEALHQSILCQVTPTPAAGGVDKSLMAAVKTEMTLFESRMGVRGRGLQLIYNYTVSVASERASSAAGVFCTKIRSR